MLDLEKELKRMSEAYGIPEKEVVSCLEEGKRVFGKIVGYEDHYLTKADVVVGIRNDRVKQLTDKWKDSLTKEAYEALKNFRFMYSLDGRMYRGFYK